MKHITRKKVKTAAPVIVAIALCVVIVFLLIHIFKTANYITQEYITVQPEEYHEWNGHIPLEEQELKSGLYLFPAQDVQAEDMDYLYYCCTRNAAVYEYLICAEITYTKEQLEQEKERLAQVECDINLTADGENITNKVTYTEELFSYPAYVAAYAANLSYEYALVDEADCKIIYVYMQVKDGNGILPSEYLPTEYLGRNIYEDNSWDNINIYFGKDKHGDYSFYRE